MSDRKHRFFEDDPALVDRFGLLLLLTTIAVMTLSLVDFEVGDEGSVDIGLLVLAVTVGSTLLLAFRASGVARRYRLVAAAVVGIDLLATAAAVIIAPSATLLALPRLTWVVFSAVAPIAVVIRLTKHRRASVRTLLGAVSAYLLVAIAFTFAFVAVDTVGTTPYFGVGEPSTSFMYFSLVTITTLGYGDLAAVDPFGRLLATFEAVIGQVYLVTFVGMIVGLLTSQRQSNPTS